MANDGPAFAGTKAVGADINLSVPLPGAYSGRRILKIEDISDDSWLESAKEIGTSYASVLGLALDSTTNKWSIASADKLVSAWTSRKATVVAGVSKTQMETVKSALLADASEVVATRGSLKSWLSEGQVFKPASSVASKE
jgi:hypothetical protein